MQTAKYQDIITSTSVHHETPHSHKQDQHKSICYPGMSIGQLWTGGPRVQTAPPTVKIGYCCRYCISACPHCYNMMWTGNVDLVETTCRMSSSFIATDCPKGFIPQQQPGRQTPLLLGVYEHLHVCTQLSWDTTSPCLHAQGVKISVLSTACHPPWNCTPKDWASAVNFNSGK